MRMFPAACVGKVVTVTAPVPVPGGALLPVPPPDVPTPVPVADATILSEGVAPSTGVAFVDASGVAYIPASTAEDLKTTIDKLRDVIAQASSGFDKIVEAVNKVASALTTLDTHGFLIGATAGVPSPPVATSDIAGIGTAAAEVTAASTQLQAISTELELLAEGLQ